MAFCVAGLSGGLYTQQSPGLLHRHSSLISEDMM